MRWSPHNCGDFFRLVAIAGYDGINTGYGNDGGSCALVYASYAKNTAAAQLSAIICVNESVRPIVLEEELKNYGKPKKI